MSNSFNQYPIIFTHVPRSGGTTLVSVMGRQYKKDDQFFFYVREKSGNTDEALAEFSNMPESRRMQMKLLQGHTSFGIHEDYKDYTYITLLRDPVERVISYYYYILKLPGHYLHNILMANKMKLEGFADSGLSAELDNIQTRQISGIHLKSHEKCDRHMLETAKHNLISYYKIFGITERFDETLLLLRQHFGWNYPFYTPLNIIQNKPGRDQITPRALALIEKTNSFDIELYTFAVEKFNQTINDKGPAFQRDLEKFRKYNRVIEQVSRPYTGNLGFTLWDFYVKLTR